MTTEAPWADRDILDRLRGSHCDTLSGEDLDDAIAEIQRLRAAGGYWDGFYAALTAVEEGQPLYGTTKKAVAALRVAAQIGRGITEHDLATKDEAVSGE